MKRKLLGLVAVPLVLVLTSCFSLQKFSLLKGALAPGKATTAEFVVRPASTQNTGLNKEYQFILVGVANGSPSGNPALAVQKAQWGVNGKFGGPQSMPTSAALAGAIGTDCDTSGFSFSGLSGSVTWKGFVTLNPIADKRDPTKTSVIDVGVKAISAATANDTANVIGLTGAWEDDGDGIINAPDSFICTGNATTSVFIT